jgi:lipopolysaccharide assembly outer membrane protein LptD (OstA)
VEFYRVYDAEPSSKIANLFKVAKWMHTIEPTVAYRYIPRADQSDLPVFDEVDRIPYVSEITYGITQRLVGRPGKETVTSGPYEYARLTIFQSYSLGDRYVDSEGEKRSFSNIRSELWGSLNPYLSAEWDIEFNPYRRGFDLSNFLIKGRDRRDDVLQVQYLYTKDRDQGINLDARLRTIPGLYFFGSYRYDLSNHWRVATIYGAEYQAQCWSLGFAVENWNQSPTGTQQKEVKVQLYVNLLNLGSVGHKPYQMIF